MQGQLDKVIETHHPRDAGQACHWGRFSSALNLWVLTLRCGGLPAGICCRRLCGGRGGAPSLAARRGAVGSHEGGVHLALSGPHPLLAEPVLELRGALAACQHKSFTVTVQRQGNGTCLFPSPEMFCCWLLLIKYKNIKVLSRNFKSSSNQS